MERILPPGLRRGDTIGIVSPCHIVKPGGETRVVSVLERLGFKVKLGRNLFADSWGFSASDAERADEAFSILMGEQVEPRRQFIEKNAKYANLDV